MPGHVKDVDFDFSVSDLHPGNTHAVSWLHTWVKSTRDAAPEPWSLNLLGNAVVDADSGQILGDKPFLAVAFDDAALGNGILLWIIIVYKMSHCNQLLLTV